MAMRGAGLFATLLVACAALILGMALPPEGSRNGVMLPEGSIGLLEVEDGGVEDKDALDKPDGEQSSVCDRAVSKCLACGSVLQNTKL